MVWANDGQTLFYTTDDPGQATVPAVPAPAGRAAARRPRLRGEGRAVPGRRRPLAQQGLHLPELRAATRRARYRYIPADQPAAEWKVVAPRRHEHEYEVDHHGDLFYIRTNDKGRNFRLVSAPVSDPGQENWKEVVPHRPDVMLEGLELFTNHYVLLERERGLPEFRVTDFRTGASHPIEFPEPVYSAFSGGQRRSSTRRSSATPTSRWSRRAPSSTTTWTSGRRTCSRSSRGARRLRPRALHLGAALRDRARTASKVPISLVYRKGMKRDGTRADAADRLRRRTAIPTP